MEGTAANMGIAVHSACNQLAPVALGVSTTRLSVTGA